jgi:hypothetical protein
MFASVFGITMTVSTIVVAIVWERLGAGLYSCTDQIGFGYILPGSWVHTRSGYPIQEVAEISHRRPMSEPDTIKQGWSVAHLWGLWFAFLGTSITASLASARFAARIGTPRPKTP